MNITEISLKRPITTFMVFVCFIVIGLIATRLLPVAFLPEFDVPGVFIEIPYPGSTPEEVERTITQPAEEVLGTIAGIKQMISDSDENGANIRLELKWGTNAAVKALEVREKLDGIRDQFPEDLERTFVRKFSSSDFPILTLRLSSERNLATAYDMLNRNLKRRIGRLDGVSRVDMYGVEKQEILIELLVDRLTAHHVNITRLADILGRSNFSVMAGKITDSNRRFSVRPMGEFTSLSDIENLIINDQNLRLKDIAQITYGQPTLDYGRHLDRRYAIGVDVFKEAGANTVGVTKTILEEIDRVEKLPEMQGIILYEMDNQADGIISSLMELLKSGMLGAMLAVVVLFFFLRQMRATIIVSLAVPFSLFVTLAFMYFLGLSLNIITMMALMLSIGMLVDNAVVVTESIYRFKQFTEDIDSMITKGVKNVGLAITAGTMTTGIVFLPNILNPQDEISMYLKHVGVTIVIALGASLFIALSIIPLLARKVNLYDMTSKKTVIDKLIVIHHRFLKWLLLHRKTSTLVVVLLLVSIAIPIKFVKKDLFPPQEDREIRLRYNVDGKYRLENVVAAVDRIEDYLFENQEKFEIESIYSYYQTDYAMSTIILREKEDATKSLEQIKEEIRADLPKLAIADPSFEMNRTSGSGEGVNVQIEGKSSSQLASLADDVEWVLSNVDGLIDVRSEADLGEEEVHVVVDRDRAGQYGFSAQDVAATVTIALRGQRLRSYRTGEGEVDMRVKLQKEDQRSLDDLKNLPIFNQNGQSVRLATLANFSIKKGPQNVHRENRKTMIDISADVDGITVDEAKEKIRIVMDRYNFPPGYSWSFGRTFSYEDETGKTMMLNTILALLLIYLVMAALFESLIYPAAIWSSIIYAIVGVWWFFLITGTTFSLMAWIGILILMGVVVNNGIVLIDHVNQLRAEGMPRNEAILQGGKDRLRPILMTAGTTILGLTPLCFGTTLIGGGGPPYFPMARAIVGGLAFSTVVTLIVLPSIYIMLDDLRSWSLRILAKSKI